MNSITIGIDGHMIGDRSGGNESYYLNLLLNMSFPEEWNVYLFLMKGTKVSENIKKNYKVIYYESDSAFKRVFFENSRLCKKYHLDILHLQYFIPFTHPRTTKLLCMIHDISFEHYKDIFTKKEYYRQKLLIPYAAKYSDIVFTDSTDSKKDLINSYHLDPDKVVITYAGVNESYRKLNGDELNENELRKKFQIGSNPYILAVGNLQPRKNIERLIQAFIELKKNKDRKEVLVIVGKKAWKYDSILAAAENDDIIFTDYVENDDLVRLYNAAAIFVYPSFFEGFGLPPLEAMACGTPVAVSNTTSLPEVVGNAGAFFDPFDVQDMKNTIISVLDDDELRKELIQSGFSQARNFSWKMTAEIVTETYKRAVNIKE